MFHLSVGLLFFNRIRICSCQSGVFLYGLGNVPLICDCHVVPCHLCIQSQAAVEVTLQNQCRLPLDPHLFCRDTEKKRFFVRIGCNCSKLRVQLNSVPRIIVYASGHRSIHLCNAPVSGSICNMFSLVFSCVIG